MRYLLDTHAYLWWLGDPNKLGKEVFRVLEDESNQIFVSLASFWELAIKSSIGKLSLSRELGQLVEELPKDGMRMLEISPSHCVTVEKLPFHHRDPFDRMLISQAIRENMVICSRDGHFDAYGVRRVW